MASIRKSTTSAPSWRPIEKMGPLQARLTTLGTRSREDELLLLSVAEAARRIGGTTFMMQRMTDEENSPVRTVPAGSVQRIPRVCIRHHLTQRPSPFPRLRPGWAGLPMVNWRVKVAPVLT